METPEADAVIARMLNRKSSSLHIRCSPRDLDALDYVQSRMIPHPSRAETLLRVLHEARARLESEELARRALEAQVERRERLAARMRPRDVS